MNFKQTLFSVLTSAALIFSSGAAEARGTANQTKATIAGAAAGAALGALAGQDTKSTLIGAAAGGLLGNAYAYHNKKLNSAETENQRKPYRIERHHHKSARKHHRGYRHHHAYSRYH